MDASSTLIRRVIAARRKREAIFPPGLFADPGWDILLDLYAATMENRRISVSSACLSAMVPPTTGLRWVNNLFEAGMVIRESCDDDRRRSWLMLSNEGYQALDNFFDWTSDTSLFAEDLSRCHQQPKRAYHLMQFTVGDLLFEIGRRVDGDAAQAR